MKDIITIVIRLTVSCLMAATVMGLCFIFTSSAKKHNEHVREQRVMYELLGYDAGAEIPESVSLYEIYRYVVSRGTGQSIAYLLPEGEDDNFLFVEIDLDGKFLNAKPMEMSEQDALEHDVRTKHIQADLGETVHAEFADQILIATDDGKRTAYIIGGKFQGFKTFINVMMAVKPDFSILGLEILEHEEDPGLGAEIEQDYFKNQFKDKPFEALKVVDVVKAPIPDDYLKALNNKVSEEDVLKFREQYKDKDIYAITGATISTRAVSNGVKAIVMKFAYRVTVLDKVLEAEHIAVPF